MNEYNNISTYRLPQKNWKTILGLIAISAGIPIGLHFILRDKAPANPPTPVVVQSHTNTTSQQITSEELIKLLSMVSRVQTNVVTVTNHVVERVVMTNYIDQILLKDIDDKLNIQWLASPVTQSWNWNDKSKLWETALPYKDSMRASPSIVIGLREDGVVVWKKITGS